MQSIGLLFKVVWSPGEAMFLLSKTPRVLVPMLFLCLSSLATIAVVMTKVDYAELNMRMLERSSFVRNMPEEQKAQMRKGMNSPGRNVLTVAAATVVPAVLVVAIAAIYFGLFTIVGREGSFKAFLSITAFAFVPNIFRQLAMILSAFVVPASSLMLDELGSLSPAVFLDRDAVSPVLFAASNTIDLVSIWILSLLVIGFGFVTRKGISKVTRVGVVFGVFLLYMGYRLALAAVFGV
jgi:Yip1 domain